MRTAGCLILQPVILPRNGQSLEFSIFTCPTPVIHPLFCPCFQGKNKGKVYRKSKTKKYQNASRLGATKQRGQRSWRRAVTGSPDTRIRDYIKGVPQVNTETMIED